MGLKVIIIGGGIAGFSCAIALRRAGHEVHIYERSSFNNEIGAAIHIPPNASRALLPWGMDPVRSKLVFAKIDYRARGTTLEKLYEANHEYVTEKYGAPWFFAHRVDLHDELKRLATEPGAVGSPAQIHLNSDAVEFYPEKASVRLANGEVVAGDFIIAADGIHSTAVNTILGCDHPPQPQDNYNYCFRFLIPASDIEEDPVTRWWNRNDDGRFKAFVDQNKRIASYPCRNNEIHNFVAIFHTDDEASRTRREDWQSEVEKSKLIECFSDFHSDLQAILRKATDVKQWALLYRPPLPTWRKGKLLVVGDAAHPMLPHQGQGGAQGIEDGVAMGILMVGAESKDVPQRLELFEKLRHGRCSAIQIFSNAGQDEPERIAAEASKFIPVDSIPRNVPEYFDFNFGYDIIRDSVLHMEQLDSDFELPGDFFQVEQMRGVYP
ncbi:salicylate hydroxylase [Pseudomassariella vexata]|uniref:Salicylate hydroxylase n=1 Tax=Pseudomassariella vexata TaxID=1141098 RepID=A0A1Y2EJE0_9PEZI|nr:salicylate hydroxylase [Pseudomassariella vexata]ORY71376.1 salicylate hydroxylase [Pseudomassariella vexata]